MKTNRSWNECIEAWEEKKDALRRNPERTAQLLIASIDKGSEPASFPPVGVELTPAEFSLFKAEGRDLHQILAWCESGSNVHSRFRLMRSFISDSPQYIGVSTPRNGFYKVVSVEGDTLRCYYNYKRSDAFLEETVEISRKPLFNRYSVGSKDSTIEPGDIIEVKNVVLEEHDYCGQPYKAYSITWRLL